MSERESFLSRWSRRKLKKPRAGAQPDSPPAPGGQQSAPAPVSAPASPPPDLPSVDSLQGLNSEYRDFLRPGVDEGLRREALKKLFRDPRFNVMDGLDVYIDDYSRPDPIPEAMLRNLQHVKGVLFPDGKDQVDGVDARKDGTSAGDAPGAAAEAPATPPRTESKT